MMHAAKSVVEIDVPHLRGHYYNATLVEAMEVNEELRVFRVRPDWPIPAFQSGQYLALGLGYWEPRVTDVQAETLGPGQNEKLVRRAYSISCAILDGHQSVVPAQDRDYLDFYVTLVRRAAHPPALTPRLFALQPGDRLLAEPHIVGHYTLSSIKPDDSVVFFATGTGEAPHNAMLAELLHRGHRGRLVSATCVRLQCDLGYLATHQQLMKQFPQYRYLSLTTREAVNIDPRTPGYVGKRYLQDYVQSGEFERDADLQLDPSCTHVFVCGSPHMIGAYRQSVSPSQARPGMIAVLRERGFRVADEPAAGTIRFEKYW